MPYLLKIKTTNDNDTTANYWHAFDTEEEVTTFTGTLATISGKPRDQWTEADEGALFLDNHTTSIVVEQTAELTEEQLQEVLDPDTTVPLESYF